MSLPTPTELEAEIAARKARLARLDKMRIALAKATIVASENLESIAKDEEVKPTILGRAADRILTYHEKFERIEQENRFHFLKILDGTDRPRTGKFSLTDTELTLRPLFESLSDASIVPISTLTEIGIDSEVDAEIRVRASQRILTYHANLCKREREEALLRHTEELFR